MLAEKLIESLAAIFVVGVIGGFFVRAINKKLEVIDGLVNHDDIKDFATEKFVLDEIEKAHLDINSSIVSLDAKIASFGMQVSSYKTSTEKSITSLENTLNSRDTQHRSDIMKMFELMQKSSQYERDNSSNS